MMLKNEVSVIYGAGGRIGGAVARAFPEAAEADALDEQAIDKHLQSVIDKADRLHILGERLL